MGWFTGLEGNLEKYIEGFFKNKTGMGIQPVEIAKKIAREMRDHRRVSISKVYVPNQYTVHLHPSEWENIASFSSLLAKELQEYARQKAVEKKYTLAGTPLVKFVLDEELEAGNIKVESVFSETNTGEESSFTGEDNIEHTQRFMPVKDNAGTGTGAKIYGRLQVNDGPDKGKAFELKAVSIVIGRREDCDIVFQDTSISRRHARLELHRSRYTVSDLESTNGTMVNGVRIGKKVLEPGDVLVLGATICTFKVD